MKWIKYIIVFVCMSMMMEAVIAQLASWKLTVINRSKDNPWLLEQMALYLCSSPEHCQKISKFQDVFSEGGRITIMPGRSETLIADIPSELTVDDQSTYWHMNGVALEKEGSSSAQAVCFLDYKQEGVQWLDSIFQEKPVNIGCKVSGAREAVTILLE